MFHRYAVPLCVLGLLLGSATAAGAASNYLFFDLGSSSDSTAAGAGSIAYGINSSNEVVGRCYPATGSAACIWSLDGPTYTRTTIPPLNGTGTAGYGSAINDYGTVVGQSSAASNNHAFMWTPTTADGTTGTLIDVGAKMPGVTLASRLTGINSAGQVVGYGSISGTQTGFYWDGTSSSATLIAAPSGTSNAGFSPPGQGAINDSSLVVGYNAPSSGGDVAVTWQPGNANATSINAALQSVLAPPDESCSSLANGVNNANEVIGYAMIDIYTDGVPFLYQDPSHIYDLGSAEPATMNGDGHALAISNSGIVVGYGEMLSNSNLYHAFVWTPSTPDGSTGTMVDLNDVVALPPALSSAGYYFQQAYGVNDSGSIVGELFNGTTYRAFSLIAPLPGDANLDGTVDINDLTIVLAHYGQTDMAWAQGEFTGDGTVDINDLTIVLAHYDQSLGSSAGAMAAVPEPAVAALAISALAALVALRKRLL